MKKIIILVVSIAALAGLGYYAMSLSENQGKSDLELIDFSIKDVESVDKVIITDKFERRYTIQKKGDLWTGPEGECITQDKVKWVLDAFKNIKFKGYLSDKSIEHFTKQMSAQHIKVEIFQNGEWTKTWYIGPSTQDHMGQIMLLDSKEEGKSTVPVQMELSNMKGIIEPRFYADPMQWKCTDIFKLSLDKIRAVDVKFNDEPQRSFKVTKSGQDIKVYQKGKQLQDVSPQNAYTYLNSYQKVHWETANYVLNKDQVDSLKNTTPFCVLKVDQTNGKTTKLRLFRILAKENQVAGMAEVVNPDLNHLWCELPNGRLVKCQYYVFNPLIMGHVYFPLDLTGVTTIDGMREDPNKEQ